VIRTRIGLILAGALAAIGGAVACGGGASPDPSPTITLPTVSPSTQRPTHPTTAPTTNPPTSPAPTASQSPSRLTAEQRNAVGTATDYLRDQHFSRKGLIDQLKFEGYSTHDATLAVDSLKVDWNAQAAGVAKDYLQDQHFSRAGLTSQLEFEGFTSSQAKYGVAHSGL